MVAAKTPSIATRFDPNAKAVVFTGDTLAYLRSLPDASVQLVVTSPPYNLGKEYEKNQAMDAYVSAQRAVIRECHRVLKPDGSICWQVGNFVAKDAASSIVPLDIALYPAFAELGMKLRNRIVWHFEHGLHCSKRFSGRYETVLWFTKGDTYHFDLDPVRVPQKYPGKKYFRGPKAGQYSCNPLGKNPGDLWVIPNVKSNHVEKTDHPCQFPVELVERLVLALSREDEWVLDPFLGVGSTIVAALRHGRRGMGAEIMPRYADVAKARIRAQFAGTLKVRPMNQPVFNPADAGRNLLSAPWLNTTMRYPEAEGKQMALLDKKGKYRV